MDNNCYEEVVKYCSDKYNYIVLRGIDNGISEPEFWTLEQDEENALRRVSAETEAYGNVDEYQFFYKKLIRVEDGPWHHRPTIQIVTKVDW